MKATGVVRRIDDLGRVVIPREIRRNLGIKEGDPLELFTTEGGICLVPYRKDVSEILNSALEQIDTMVSYEEYERIKSIFKENNLI